MWHGDRDASALVELTGRPTAAPLELAGRLTAALIPSASLHAYEAADHGLHFTHAESLNQDWLAFRGRRPA